MILRMILIIIIIMMGLTACTPSFQSASEVLDLRVLAVQAEPPEAQFDETGVDDVHVRVLAVDPARPGGFALMKWELCAPTDSHRCDNGPLFGYAGSQSRQGTNEFPATTISVPLQLVQAALAGVKLGDLGGIRVQFSFSVDDGDPNGPAYASKDLLYSPRGTPPNHNPLMTGIHLTLAGADAGTVTPGQSMCLPLGVQIGLRPLLAPDARETYTTTDLQGRKVTLTEDPEYSFFSTPGADLDRDSALEPADGVAPPDGIARIRANSGSGTFYIVIRDGRGGESWLSFPWTTPLLSQCAPAGARGRSVRP